MASSDRTIAVKASVAAVWALVGDPVRWPEFQAALARAERVDERRVRLFGSGSRSYSYTVLITEFVPLSRIAWTYDIAVKGGGSYDLREVEGGTEVRVRESLRMNIWPPFRWIIDWAFFDQGYNRAAKATLEELQRVAEGREVRDS